MPLWASVPRTPWSPCRTLHPRPRLRSTTSRSRGRPVARRRLRASRSRSRRERWCASWAAPAAESRRCSTASLVSRRPFLARSCSMGRTSREGPAASRTCCRRTSSCLSAPSSTTSACLFSSPARRVARRTPRRSRSSSASGLTVRRRAIPASCPVACASVRPCFAPTSWTTTSSSWTSRLARLTPSRVETCARGSSPW